MRQELGPAEEAPLALVPLGTLTLQVRPPLVIDPTPAGSRWLVEAAGGRIEGDRLTADIDGSASADWFVLGANQIGTVDARLRARTADGAALLLWYGGRVDMSNGLGPIYIAPRFECADER